MDSLILVNKKYRLAKDYIPKDLEYVDVRVDIQDEKKFMRREACIKLREMFYEADKEGIELVAISGFRSYSRQEQIFRNSVFIKGEEHARRYVAMPGCSEHQSGLALDVSCKVIGYELEESFAETDEGFWLKNHVQNYGFIIRYPKGLTHITGYEYEPWHIRYIGEMYAKDMKFKNIYTLEEYLQYIRNKYMS